MKSLPDKEIRTARAEAGGAAVVAKYGSDYMRKLGSRGGLVKSLRHEKGKIKNKYERLPPQASGNAAT